MIDPNVPREIDAEIEALRVELDALRADNEELRAERDTLKDYITDRAATDRRRTSKIKKKEPVSGQMVMLAGEVMRLESERNCLRIDAERWAYVNKHPRYQGTLNGYRTFLQAIDAAIAASPSALPKE